MGLPWGDDVMKKDEKLIVFSSGLFQKRYFEDDACDHKKIKDLGWGLQKER